MNPTLADIYILLIVILTIVALIFLYILSQWCYSCCSSSEGEINTRTLSSEVSTLSDKVVKLQRIVHNQTIVLELENQNPVQIKTRDRNHHVSFRLPSPSYEQVSRNNSPEELLGESQLSHLIEETYQSPIVDTVREETVDPNHLRQILIELQDLRSISEDNKALVETHTDFIAKIQSQLSKRKHQ